MIKQISTNEFIELNGLISECMSFFKQKLNREIPLKEQIISYLENKSQDIFAIYNDRNQAVGLSIVNLNASSINLIYIMNQNDETKRYEKLLFDHTFSYMKNSLDHFRIRPLLSEHLTEYIVDVGVSKIKRASMSIERSIIENLVEEKLPDEYSLKSWNNEYKLAIAEIVNSSHFTEDRADSIIFPQFCGIDGSKKIIEEITSNIYGQFKDQLSIVLAHNNDIIGICYFTGYSDHGYIPEIALSNAYQGKKLGKMLLIYSLRNFILNEENISAIKLDVTLDNEMAYNLYKSIGFKTINEYEVYVYKKKDYNKN